MLVDIVGLPMDHALGKDATVQEFSYFFKRGAHSYMQWDVVPRLCTTTEKIPFGEF